MRATQRQVPMNVIERNRLVEAVQTNCHIADARHAADMTLCIYLLQMREFFRWERSIAFGAALARADVGIWIADRESLWSSLEGQAFVALPGGGHASGWGPFDVAAVNDCLRPEGLLYGAGLVGAQRPVFFLAELHGQARRDGLDVVSAGREIARGLVAPPAALSGGAGGGIVLRRESLARWCWEKFEAFTLHRRPGSPFHEVVEAYGFERDFDAALARCVDEQAETLVLHELGEHRAGLWLEPGWAEMRLALPSRRAELYARAVRDQLADLSVTLPALLERGAAASIHFWFANYEGVRAELYPSLQTAYEAWRHGDGGRTLRQAIEQGAMHFTRLTRQTLDLHNDDAAGAGPAIEQMLTAPEAVCRG
jgi:hypothetical protein